MFRSPDPAPAAEIRVPADKAVRETGLAALGAFCLTQQSQVGWIIPNEFGSTARLMNAGSSVARESPSPRWPAFCPATTMESFYQGKHVAERSGAQV